MLSDFRDSGQRITYNNTHQVAALVYVWLFLLIGGRTGGLPGLREQMDPRLALRPSGMADPGGVRAIFGRELKATLNSETLG